MSRRKSVHVVRRQVTDGGESPNRYIPQIAIDIRAIYPPHTDPLEVTNALSHAYLDVVHEIWENEP